MQYISLIEEMKKSIISSFVGYCKESYDELVHKVSWPSYSNLSGSAVVVSVASILIAIVVYAMDSLFRFVMTGIIYPN